jgi:hypothetical protein
MSKEIFDYLHVSKLLTTKNSRERTMSIAELNKRDLPFKKNTGRIIKLAVFGGILFSLISSFAYQFAGLIYFPLDEKIVILLVPWMITMCILWLANVFSKSNLPGIFYKSPKRLLFLLSIAILFTIFITFFCRNLFPSWNKFIISVSPVETTKTNVSDLSILEIVSISPENTSSVIPYYKIITTGGCQQKKIGIGCLGNEKGTIEYQEFSNNSLSILLEGSPTGGEFQTSYNNKIQTIDTYRENDDQFSIAIPYYFDWQYQSVARKAEIILIFLSNSISIFFLLALLFYIFSRGNELVQNVKENKRIAFSILVLITTVISNLLLFQNYQKMDIYRLQRVPGNTLIDLDMTSHDNKSNLQVYLNFFQYFRNNDLYLTKNQLSHFRLTAPAFLIYSQIKSVNSIAYKEDLSLTDIESLQDKKIVTIPPSGRIDFTYKLILDPLQTELCAWTYQDTLYFIPINDKFDCRKGNANE